MEKNSSLIGTELDSNTAMAEGSAASGDRLIERTRTVRIDSNSWEDKLWKKGLRAEYMTGSRGSREEITELVKKVTKLGREIC